jgi:hypothetical protein
VATAVAANTPAPHGRLPAMGLIIRSLAESFLWRWL